ncbi:DUF4493 domain-containing protein [uncultured Bacteroides sp.]|jgi:hypothetical protein|uniref:DUF4493 domain-containing protein n=1 Tax=uncultured Bacteroides sp. TaxID=162156 RepID=UPI0025F1B752|nr:DUF4493 domain-containing protein [uncultured Bacteroides sp.]
MRKKVLGLTLLWALLITACSQEEVQDSLEQGKIRIEVVPDGKLTQTRATDIAIPDSKEFGVNIVSSTGETIVRVDNLHEFEPVSVPVGIYTVHAYYGDADAEGFDALSFAGSNQVSVKRKEESTASVDCSINKALVAITYTDAFKKYFSDYSAYVSTSKGGKVVYADNEVRSSYFVPGNLGIFLEVTKEGSSNRVTLNPKNFVAEAHHEYRLTMDVDASTATLRVVFNSQPAHEENVEINVSDEALNAPAPAFKAHGFVAGNVMEYVEGMPPANDNGSKYSVYLNAQGKIEKVMLTAVSPWWTAQQYPAEQNLVELNKTYWNGMELVGLSDRRDKIASVDFTSMLKNLACQNREAEFEEHTFTFTATDRLTKVGEPMVVKVKTLNDCLAVAKVSEPHIGDTQLTIALTMNGVSLENLASVMKFAYKNDKAFFSTVAAKDVKVEKGDAPNRWNVTLTLPALSAGTLDVKATSPARNEQMLTYEIKSEILLSQPNGTADVWARMADVQLKPVGTAVSAISSDKVSFQCLKGDEWTAVSHVYESSGDRYTLTGLDANTRYEVRALYLQDGKSYYSQAVSFTTEKEVQVANNSFEDWEMKPRISDYWEYYFFNSGWDTMNGLTTSEGGNSLIPRNRCRYNANSGTIPSEGDAKTGTKAALIRAVGWGSGNSAVGTANAKYGTVGELYLGHYDSSSKKAVYDGAAFESRPLSMSFWYKYRPGNGGDQLWAEVQVLHKENGQVTVLGEGSARRGDAVNEWTELSVPVTYKDKSKKATHIVIKFKSGDKSDNPSFIEVPPFANLSNGEYVGSKLWVDDVMLNYMVK